ncbi:hypothetical protein B0H13DRAFT_2348405 [Mycena leptocephala]|nr:hypothetical protein B0H13DRAFT_2348405 [Mycena leptocephala]
MSHYTASNFWLIAFAKPLHIVEDTISWSTEEEGVPYDGDKIKIRINVPPSVSLKPSIFFVNGSDAQLLFSLCLVHAPDLIVHMCSSYPLFFF